jgi:hypothetical protein
MGNTLTKNGFAMPEPLLGTQQFGGELLEIVSAKVLEFASLQQIPHSFLWVQLRGVAGQLLQMDALSSAVSQKILHRLTPVNGSPIPDDQQLARELAQEQVRETHDIWTLVRGVLDVHDQSSIHGETTHRREMITGQCDLQHGRLADRGIGPHHHWQQIKSRLIYKDDGALFLFGLFFSSAERCSRHSWIAASSRWLACSTGFCRLCLILCRRREQCVG